MRLSRAKVVSVAYARRLRRVQCGSTVAAPCSAPGSPSDRAIANYDADLAGNWNTQEFKLGVRVAF